VALGLVVAVVLLLVIGGALHVGRASRPYWRDLDRSYALQATVVIEQSNAQGATLGRLMGSITRLSRPLLQVQLDALVQQSRQSADDAVVMSTPEPAGGVGAALAAVLAERASALADLRQAVDGVLELAPLPVPGTASASDALVPGPAWSQGRASSAMARAGSTLAAADRSYAVLRRQLLAAPGHPRLPRSVWVPTPAAWSGPAMAGLVAAITAGGSPLAPVRQLCVLVVNVTPAPVPPPTASSTQPPPGRSPGGGCPAPPASPSTATVPPTSSLGVSVVVGNVGTVAQRAVSVDAVLQPVSGQATVSSSRVVSLQPGTSVAVNLPSLGVRAATSYTLRVSLGSAASQSDPSGAAAGPYPITVAPPTPPPTTTTTAPPPTRSTSTTAVRGSGQHQERTGSSTTTGSSSTRTG
jgi:hypothetical protein